MGHGAWGNQLGTRHFGNLFFGLPPFGRVPGFALRILNFEFRNFLVLYLLQ